jgi:hypothetical protein
LIALEITRILAIWRSGTMVAPATGMDDDKMPRATPGTARNMTVKELKVHIDDRFTHVDERFAQVDERFAQVDERFAQVDRRFDELKVHTSTLIESLRDDIHKVAEGVAANTTAITALRHDPATVRTSTTPAWTITKRA